MISLDPCEYNDLSKVFPDVVTQLQSRLEEFRKSARPVWYPPVDKEANPAKFGGYWAPWKELKDNTSLINSWISVSTLLAIDLLGGNHADAKNKQTPCNLTFADSNVLNEDVLPNVPSDVAGSFSSREIASNLKNACEASKDSRITWTPYKPVEIYNSEEPENMKDRFYYRKMHDRK